MTLVLPMCIHDEVKSALASGLGVVALESTLISHGLPYPDNVVVANELHAVIREEGAIPAMIAMSDGNLQVGLEPAAIEILAQAGAAARKVSRRDIAYALATRSMGATTVSATMIIAHLAGLKIFATGGIGGVHRGAEKTMDISADLTELAKTPVAVVCAGAKSILDLPKTLEVLETLGVPIFAYGTDYFPEFYCTGGRYQLDMRFDKVQDIAQALHIHWGMGLKSGVVIAQSVPEKDALDNQEIDQLIQEAIEAAAQAQVQGKNLTPFLLRELAIKSLGQSLQSNRALLLNNARLAAQIAMAGQD